MGVAVAMLIVAGVVGAYVGTRHAPVGARRGRLGGRCATSCGSWPARATSGCC